jgi:MFS family permease
MVSNASFFTSLSALEADLVPRERRGRTSAVLGLVASFSAATGQAFTGFAYENISPRFPFFVATAVLIAALGIAYFLVREPKEREL